MKTISTRALAVLFFIVSLCSIVSAQFISSDTYTRYELLPPDTHQFKIYYEVTENRGGSAFHFNQIREGSEATDESVVDLATGKPLKFEVVTGAQAKAASPNQNFPADAQYIKVVLAHPVPAGGEYRLAIIKTYKDDKSYYSEGENIVFKRPLGIPRDSIVLPAGYEIVSCSVATQVLMGQDGRLKLAFVNPGSGGQLEVNIRAKKLAAPAASTSGTAGPKIDSKPAATPSPAAKAAATPSPAPPPTAAPNPWPFSERAYQDREILYELQSPETNAFRITHDYTVRRNGEQYYFNVVRAGSHVLDPESVDLDTGEKLKYETISGKQAAERKLPVGESLKDDSEIVVTHLARPVKTGETNRIRLKETYVDAKSLYVSGDELVWDRTFGRLRNTVVLPAGWYLTALSSPAIIETLRDGRTSIYVVNPRSDDVRVYLRARKRH